MNFNNFTIKAQEAVQEAVNLVQSRGQQAIEPVHVLQSVMKVGENVTNFIFQKLGMNGQQIALVLDKQIDSLPKVSGGEPYLSRETNEVFHQRTAKRRKSNFTIQRRHLPVIGKVRYQSERSSPQRQTGSRHRP